MMDIEDENCFGCRLCGEVCPTGAISYVKRNGFYYPKVDMDKCINCELCKKKCPAINKEKNNNMYPKTYAAWIKDDAQRVECTSGGICFELAREILMIGGCVAGVVWTDNFRNACYKLIYDLNELPTITQTKYFQPQMGNIYKDIKKALEAGKQVLFIGTACTNAALRFYLGKQPENLYCCDFICRGYSSQIYHEKRIIDLETKHNSKVSSVQYKNKDINWNMFGTKFKFKNGDVVYVNRKEDPYEIMFHKDDFNTRSSCLECKYRETPRLADITVGDFWGVKGIDTIIQDKGVSAVMLNSSKGIELFERIKEKINIEERTLWEISKGNPALLKQLKRKKNGVEDFFSDLEKKSMDYVHNKYGRKEKGKIMFNRIRGYLALLRRLDLLSFVYLNFLCSSVKREKNKFIFPYYGAKIYIETGGKIILNDNIHVNRLKHKYSKEEAYIHIYDGGLFEINGKIMVAANNTIEVLSNAFLSMGETDMNYGTTIICSNKIVMGNGVAIGRNVMIYDSNFHNTGLVKRANGKPLLIEDHVWLCSGVTIAKGVKIGTGAICGLNSMVTKNVKSRHMVLGNPAKDVMSDVEW